MIPLWSTRVRAAAPCALAIAACFLAPSARAEDPAPRPAPADTQQGQAAQDDARKRFGRGLELYREADYAAALIEFRRAYVQAPNYRLLYNIGQVCFQLQKYACALQNFEQYLSEGGSEVPAPRRTSVENDIDKLRSRVAKVTVKTNVRGATILVDDEAVGKTPLDFVLVSAGTRRIAAAVDGRTVTVRTISVAGEESATVDLDVADSPQPKAEGAAAAAAPPRAPSPPTPSWPFWVSTGVLAAGAGITGVLAMGASSDLQQQRSAFGATRQQLQSTESRASTTALVSDVLTGAAVVSGGIALYLTLTSKKRMEMTTPAPQAKASPVSLQVGFLTVGVDGTF